MPRVHLAALATIAALVTACSGSGGGSTKPATLVAAGLRLEQQGNSAAASQLFQQALRLDPADYYASYDLGYLAQQAGNLGAAQQYYSDALTANPTFVPALYNQGTIYSTTDPGLAVATFRRVVALQVHSPSAYLNLAILEAKSGDTAAATRDLKIALQQDPSLATSVPASLRRELGK